MNKCGHFAPQFRRGTIRQHLSKAPHKTPLLACLALPNNLDTPARPSQGADGREIAGDVFRELVAPERDAALGARSELTSSMAVPEAAVHEDGQFARPENQIGTTREVSPMQSVARTHATADRPDHMLRSSVPASYARHDPAADRLGDDVGQGLRS